MRRRQFIRPPVPTLAATPLASAAPPAAQDATAPFESAYVAWDAGDYPAALETLDPLQAGPGVGARVDNGLLRSLAGTAGAIEYPPQ